MPKPKLLSSFPNVFWVANVMELFERAAYYGMNAVLAIYLTNAVSEGGLGFSEQSVGFLQGLIYALTYIVPIVGGALADRYGYRRMLLIAFSLLATGYFVTGHMSAYGTVFASLLVMSTGAGLFKPIISGTIARSTTEENSGMGFGIYYWMINVGAFLAPLFVTYLRGFAWSYVFTASSAYCALMLLPAAFLYREPVKGADVRSLATVARGAVLVLGDARFMLMILLYSGFWILYFQTFGSVLWYLRDFIDTAPFDRILASIGIPVKFDAEHVTVVNAGTIILLQVLVSKAVQRAKPLVTMSTGMVIGVLGFVILSFASTIWLFVLGLVVFSIGEMTAHPKYFSYVGLVAPAEQKAVYMGYSFLYGVVGSLIGSNLGGTLYERMMKPVIGQPEAFEVAQGFWLLFAGMGTVAIAGLLLYHRYLSADTPATNRIARSIMLVMYIVVTSVGAWFFYTSAIAPAEVSYKTMVQSFIMLLIGGGGIAVTLARRPHEQERGS